jgi:hypothetical protein
MHCIATAFKQLWFASLHSVCIRYMFSMPERQSLEGAPVGPDAPGAFIDINQSWLLAPSIRKLARASETLLITYISTTYETR